MLTRCPTCQTTFRVTAEQLKARQGRVRCGQCLGVFNALESLIEEAPATAPAAEAVVIEGFEVSSIADAPEASSLAAKQPSAEPVAIPPLAAVSPIVATEGEEVAEPEVDYVEIGGLESGDDEFTDTLTSPVRILDDAFTETEVNVGQIAEPGTAGDNSDFQVPAEQSPDDQFTKTVVGFTWYVEPEPTPALVDQPVADEFTRTVIAPWRSAAPEAAPATVAQTGDNGAADTVIESIRIFEPKTPPVADERPAEAAVAHAAPIDDDFAKTVLQSVKFFEPELPPAPEENSVADEFVRTSIETRWPPAPESAAALEADPEPAQAPTKDQFVRTVFDSARGLNLVDQVDSDEAEFALAPIDEIHVEQMEEIPSIVDTAEAPKISFPELDLLTETDETAHESANAILENLATADAAPPRPIRPPEAEHQAEPIAEPVAGLPSGRSKFEKTQPGEPSALAAESVPAPEVDSIPELQELPTRRRWPWVLGAMLAIGLLAAQAIIHFRVEASVLMPRSKPALMAICDVLGCNVALPSQIDLIGIETSDLSPGPEGAGHLQLAATLRNRAPFAQAWPHLELTLTDGADKALIRRTLAPTDYLPPVQKSSEGFPAKSERTVYLDLKAPGVPAVGYRLYVFYP